MCGGNELSCYTSEQFVKNRIVGCRNCTPQIDLTRPAGPRGARFFVCQLKQIIHIKHISTINFLNFALFSSRKKSEIWKSFIVATG